MARRGSHPWSSWPPASQQRLFRMVTTGLWGLMFALFVGLGLFTGTIRQQISEAKEQYAGVVPLVKDIRTLRARRGEVAHLAPMAAVQSILDDRMLDDYVVSMHSTRVDDKTPAVEVSLHGLTLIMLTDFLQDVRDKANLQTPELTLTRDPKDPRLADLQLVLAR